MCEFQIRINFDTSQNDFLFILKSFSNCIKFTNS